MLKSLHVEIAVSTCEIVFPCMCRFDVWRVMCHPRYVHVLARLSTEYTDRLNVEFMKLGVRGITVIFASGDTGIASEYPFDDPQACAVSHPEFPASSPVRTRASSVLSRRECCTYASRIRKLGHACL